MSATRRGVIGLVTVGSLVLLGLVGADPAMAVGVTLSVTTTADDNPASGPCANNSTTPPSPLSLRDAVCVANNDGGTVTIDVPAGDYKLGFGELDAGLNSGQNLTLSGAGAASTTIDAQGHSRVLNLDENLVGGITVKVSGLTITGGADSSFGGAGIIGGSANASSADSLDIESSVITANAANATNPTVTNNPGGGVQFIGGALTVKNSTISGNSSLSSGGSGVYYEANGLAPGESLTIDGDTFSGNQTANSTGSSVPTDGALVLSGPATGVAMTVSDSTFSGNAATGTSGPVRGAGLTVEGGTATINDDNFTGNSISGSGSAGAAIAVVAGTATIQDDRIVGNQVSAAATGTGIENIGGAVTATDDWWGCNAGPGNAGCDTTVGTLTTSPRLTLSGSPVTLAYDATATVSADIAHDSLGAGVGFGEGSLNGDQEAFTDPEPAGTGCSPASVTFSGGTALGSCTFAANGHAGLGHVEVTVDNQTITVPVTVTEPATVDTDPADDQVPVNSTASFTAAAEGYPAPTVQWQVSTDGGHAFADIAGATSPTLSFTATAAATGNEYRAVFTNSTGTATTTAARLTVVQAPAFTSAPTATFQVGTAGSFTITTSGLPQVVAIAPTAGALPSGLTLHDDGDGTATISGTPAPGTGGLSQLSLDASNGIAPDATQTLTITVDEAPAVTSNPSGAAVAPGDPATFSAAASGYPAPTVQWQVSTDGGASYHDIAGATSSPLSFTAAVSQSGNSYRAVFTNSTGSATTTAATLQVQAAPTFSSANATTFTAGSAGTFSVTTAGYPNAAITESGALPPGVTFTDNGNGTGTLAGTPAAGTGGTYSISFSAANGIAPDGAQAFTLVVDEAPDINSGATAQFTVGSSSSFAVTTDRGNPTPALSESGALPSGLTFADNGDGTATIAGTPAAGSGGSYSLTITASNGIAPDAVQTLTVDVSEPTTITSAASTTFNAGSSGAFTVTTGGGFPTTVALSESGALPSGVTFVDNGDGTATLAGTAAAGTGGSYPLTITASNGVSPNATQSFTLTVDEAPTITSEGSTILQVGSAGSFEVTTAAGFPTTTTLSESGALPSGVTFTDNGDGTATLAGTPAAGTAGSYPLTVTAASGANAATQSFTLTVVEAPTITSGDATTFTAGSAGTFTVTTSGTPTAVLSESGALPSGVTFADNGDGTATLAGTPAPGTGGRYPLTLTAINEVAPNATQSFTLTVDETPSITSAVSATFGAGVAGTFTVTTTGYPAPAITESGALPGGVTFTDNGGGTATLAGTTTAAGSYPITVTASNGVGADATQLFTLTVSTAPQAITFTSTPPASPVVGQTYPVSATGGGSGNPVTFAIDASATGVCSIDGSGTVTFDHPGSCVIDASQAGNSQYAPGSGSQTATVTKAMTSLALAVHPTSLTAAVSVTAPGAGTPSGSVTFAVDGTPVGSAPLSGATATLSYPVPSDKTHDVTASYTGDNDFAGSSASTARNNPTITATLSSRYPRTAYGWYRAAVVVTFHCTTHGAPLSAACPSPVTFSKQGAGQSVTKTIMATDGGAATVVVRGINIDLTPPTVSITGPRNGAVYPGTAPAPRCVVKDALSGVAGCAVSVTSRNGVVTVRATGVDRAGNSRTVSISYQVLQFYVLGAPLVDGAYQLRQGHEYTLVALTAGTTLPRFYDAAPHGQTPRPADHYFHRAGTQYGLHRFELVVLIQYGLGRYRYWDLGVKIGATMHLIKFHPTS